MANLFSAELEELKDLLQQAGPTPEELCLLSIISLMDEALQDLSRDKFGRPRINMLYEDIDHYIQTEGLGH